MTDSVNFVIVTATEYTTIYPSAPALMQLTTPATPLATMVQKSTAIASSAATSIVASIATQTPSMTGLLPLPTSFEEPDPQPQSRGYSDKVPELALTAVILMAVLFFAFLGYAIFLRFRGKCKKCARIEDNTGKTKAVSRSMVRDREALNAHNPQADARNSYASASTRTQSDLEKGVMGEDEREKERAATLAALESNSKAKALWNRAKGMMAVKSNVKEPRTPSADSDDRFFAVPYVASPSATCPPTAQSLNPTLERTAQAHFSEDNERPFLFMEVHEPPLRPASSIYSRAVDSNVGRNDYAEHYVPTGPILPHAYTTASSPVGRTYGELPHPDDFEPADLGQGRG